MNKVAVVSLFRDSETWCNRPINQVGRFFAQMKKQGLPLSFYCVEGNSLDNTRVRLEEEAEIARNEGHKVTILTCETEGSRVESCVDETRFANLSKCGNMGLNAAKASGADYIFWIESDFIVKNDNLIKELLTELSLREPECLSICPIPTYETRDEFYDTFIYKNYGGGSFGVSMEPFRGDSLIKLSAFGSCGIMRSELLNRHNLDFGKNCFAFLCENANNLGLCMYTDPTLKVYHPSKENILGRLI